MVGRLHDHCVASDQGRGHLGRSEHDGVVIGHDAGAHAIGFAQRVVQDAFAHRQGLAFDLGGQARVVVNLGGGDQGVALHFDDGVAAIGRVQQGQFKRVVAQHLCHFFEQARTLQRFHATPDGKALLGGTHGGIDIGAVGLGRWAQRFTGGRVEGVEVAPLGPVPSAAVIQVAVLGQDKCGGVGGHVHLLWLAVAWPLMLAS